MIRYYNHSDTLLAEVDDSEFKMEMFLMERGFKMIEIWTLPQKIRYLIHEVKEPLCKDQNLRLKGNVENSPEKGLAYFEAIGICKSKSFFKLSNECILPNHVMDHIGNFCLNGEIKITGSTENTSTDSLAI